MPIDLNKYKDTFLSESKEHVAGMNAALLGLEKNPAKKSLINDIFRHIHTMKSMAATMEYAGMVALCHVMEDVLDSAKKGNLKIATCFDTLFGCFDCLESTLKNIKDGTEEIAPAPLIERLQALITGNGPADKDDSPAPPAEQLPVAEIAKVESIDVKVEKLDRLMNLAEEILINKMTLDRLKVEIKNPELKAAVDSLGRLISEVQYNVMQARMVSIGFVFNRFPRMVRDLAKQQEKEVTLQMSSGDIELDRSVIDEIGESLVHIFRNAVDHGLETPAERIKGGKPGDGTIILSAERTKDFVRIKVVDDGRGLNVKEIKATGIKRGLLTPASTAEEVLASIFTGVSTTKEVTPVSGRGFGLNIVKNKIESLGGTVEVMSEPGKGTTFNIELPLTLAIIKVLFVKVGGGVYAIPLANIAKLVTVNREDIKGMLEHEAVVLKEEQIIITRLARLFGGPSSGPAKQPLVIVRKDGAKLGVAVDSYIGTQEILVKPLNRLVRENKYFAGSTIIGTGAAVLILDVANLVLSKKDAIIACRLQQDATRPPGEPVYDSV